MEFSTIYDVCAGSGRPFKLTREMLDVYIEKRMKQGDETTAVTQLMIMLSEHGFKISTCTVSEPRRHWGGF